MADAVSDVVRRVAGCRQVGVRPSGGLRLWDVQFLGERILYELSLQEAMVSYGGTTPSQVRKPCAGSGPSRGRVRGA